MGAGRARSAGWGRIAAVVGSVTVVTLGIGSRVEARAAALAASPIGARIASGPSVPFSTAPGDAWEPGVDPVAVVRTTLTDGASPPATVLVTAAPEIGIPLDTTRVSTATVPTTLVPPFPTPTIPAVPPATVPPATVPPATVPPATVPPTAVLTTTTWTPPPTTQPGPEVRGQAVLASLSVNVLSLIPGWTLEFLGEDPGYRGSTFPGERRIEIYVRNDLTDAQLAHTIAHEVGHAMDIDQMDDASRVDWITARGRPGLAWWAPSGVSDYSVGSGDLAESVAWTLTDGGEWNSTVSGPPGSNQQRLLRNLLGLP